VLINRKLFRSRSKLKVRVKTPLAVRDKSSESIDISTSGSYNRYLKKIEERGEECFDFDHLDNLRRTATFTPLAREKEAKTIIFKNQKNEIKADKVDQIEKIEKVNKADHKGGDNGNDTKAKTTPVKSIVTNSNPHKNNVFKKQINQIPKGNLTPTHKKLELNYDTLSPIRKSHFEGSKLTHSRNKSIKYKEDELTKTTKLRPSTDNGSRLPSLSSVRGSKQINLEIDNIFNMADKFKEDTELQGKINNLVLNIMDIKKVLKNKRNTIQTAPAGKHTRAISISARGEKKI
jgi:hypothetical protein